MGTDSSPFHAQTPAAARCPRRARLAAAAVALLAACATAPPGMEPDGCWVHAYGRSQFRPPLTTYTGPSQEPHMVPWARSLAVGPGARVTGYAGEAYREAVMLLPPGARVADLEQIEFHKKVEAFRVACVARSGPREALLP